MDEKNRNVGEQPSSGAGEIRHPSPLSFFATARGAIMLFLILLTTFFYILMFVIVVRRPETVVASWWLVPVSLVPAVLLLFSLRRLSLNRAMDGRRQYDKRNFAKARRALVRALESGAFGGEKFAAANLLGDIYLEGREVERDVDQAVAYYALAGEELDRERRLIRLDEKEVAPSLRGDIAMPADPTAWRREVIERLQPYAAPERAGLLELLAELRYDCGAAAAALADARRLPDGENGGPGRQAAALARLLRRSVFPFPSLGAGEPAPEIGVPCGFGTSAQFIVGILMLTILAFCFVSVLVSNLWKTSPLVNLLVAFLPATVPALMLARAARLGHYGLGEACLRKGRLFRAAQYFTRAGLDHDPRGYKRLGDMYFHGQGLEKDLEKAWQAYLGALAGAEFLRHVGQLGLPYTATRRFDLQPDAIGPVKREIYEAMEAVGDAGNDEAYGLLTFQYEEDGDLETALRFARLDWARDANPGSELRLALLLIKREEAPEADVREGVAMLRQMSERGDIAAERELAALYGEGAGGALREDRVLAKRHLLRAVELVGRSPEKTGSGYFVNVRWYPPLRTGDFVLE